MNKLDAMREAGEINRLAINFALTVAQPGMTKAELDQAVGDLIRDMGGEPAFLGYHGFPGNCCICIDEEIVHGTPSNRKIEDGSILTIDCGVRIDGWNVDAASTKIIGTPRSELDVSLLAGTKEALDAGIAIIKAELDLFDLANCIHSVARTNGISPYPQFTGHGIGRVVHEEPAIHNIPKQRGTKLAPGQTIAVEPICTRGGLGFNVMEDGWTCVSSDRSLSAHFEHTLLVTEEGCEVIC